MKNQTGLQQLINATEILIDSNNRLTEINDKAFKFIKEQLIDDKETIDYLQQEFQALSDKKERSIQEEVQFLYLRKKLTGR